MFDYILKIAISPNRARTRQTDDKNILF